MDHVKIWLQPWIIDTRTPQSPGRGGRRAGRSEYSAKGGLEVVVTDEQRDIYIYMCVCIYIYTY